MALSQKNRLKAKKDFDNVFKNGRAFKGYFLLIKNIEVPTSTSKIGFIVPSKIAAKAVTRNRIKRILSNTVSKNKDLLKKNKHVVILLLKLPKEKDKETELLSKELENLISKI